MSDYTPSKHRGPGPATPVQAKTLRQQSSQHQTSSKKQKIQADTAVTLGTGLHEVVELIGGEGAIGGSYLNTRHKLGPKGRVIGENSQKAIDKIYGNPGAADCESVASHIYPRYRVGPGHAVGLNNSGRVHSIAQCTQLGFKNEFRCPIDPQRSQRLADYGVSMLTMFEAELQNEYNAQAIANPAFDTSAPTRDELLAAMQLTLSLAWNNRALPVGGRVPVDDDFNNV
jgi:hypothetical protein